MCTSGYLHKQILAMYIYCFINGLSVLKQQISYADNNNVRLRASRRLTNYINTTIDSAIVIRKLRRVK